MKRYFFTAKLTKYMYSLPQEAGGPVAARDALYDLLRKAFPEYDIELEGDGSEPI